MQQLASPGSASSHGPNDLADEIRLENNYCIWIFRAGVYASSDGKRIE